MNIYGGDLLEEKSLWSIYWQCLRKLPPSKFNFLVSAAAFVALILDCIYFPENYLNRLSLVRSLCDVGLGFGSTILGFLIAGFTIFATLAKPEMLIRMYETTHEKSGLSYLKVNFFAFVEVFAVYISLLASYLLVKIFGAENGVIESMVHASRIHPILGWELSSIWIVNVCFILLSGSSLYSLLSLKSFIFNTYHAVMTAAIWSLNPPKI